MDENTYLEHLHLDRPLSDAYCRKLAALLGDPALAVFPPPSRPPDAAKIVRVEQEAVLINHREILCSWKNG
jgi:hypothetical protein